MTSNSVLCVTLQELVDLLNRHGSHQWADALAVLRDECQRASSKSDADEVARKILRLFGGMGSLSDLVFSREDDFMPRENQELERLRNQLFRAAQAEL